MVIQLLVVRYETTGAARFCSNLTAAKLPKNKNPLQNGRDIMI
jgi:hypothetical protein